jgi:hypothetical protein
MLSETLRDLAQLKKNLSVSSSKNFIMRSYNKKFDQTIKMSISTGLIEVM